MRALVVIFTALLSACGWVEQERQEAAEAAAEAARLATLTEVEQLLSRSVQRADRLAASADRILRPLPVMTPAEEAALRRFQNGAHVAQGRALGVRVGTRGVRDSLVAAGRLVELQDSTPYWIVRRNASPAYVVPAVPALLEELGRRFQARLAEIGVPPYRIEVTSALRTSARQAGLRRTNANAAAGVSSHEFGTTVDLSYAAFAPPAELPAEVLEAVPANLRPQMERLADLALESVSGRKSRELGAIFSQVLYQAQSEGMALVIYERQQTVYHLTVARDLSTQ
ncbi:MAG TPA: DUF5715 family protein [Longimicrobiales bacterium]|nr:DUF5715 family protein [Longimicrobiales bacterium]